MRRNFKARLLGAAPRSTPTIVAMALLGCVVASAASCHWLRYHDLVRTHVDLMERIAIDVGAVIDDGSYRLRPADLQTMAYPLERARAFLAETEGSRADSASRAPFEEFVEAYQELYEYLDRVRALAGDGKSSRRGAKVDALIATVTRQAVRTRAALDEESG